MKHNPKLHERVAALPGNARLHPLQRPESAQGALELMWRLQDALGEISGLPHVSLQPSAGSHGELAGVLLTRAYHEDHGEHRTKVLTPDTAHGTNPATVTMAGYEIVKIGTDAQRQRRHRGPAREGDRGRRLPDADQPFDARAVRTADRGDRRDRARGRRDALLRRRQPQRDHGHLPSRRHGFRHRALQPAQVVHAAARRRRPGRRPDRRRRTGSSRSFRARRSFGAASATLLDLGPAHPATERSHAKTLLRPRLRPSEVDRAAARLPGQLWRVRALLRLHPLARTQPVCARSQRSRC